MTNRNYLNPIIDDVKKRYVKYRRIGKNRTTAIELIHEDYSDELHDEDDRLAVLIGLSLSLCKKKELLEPIATETLNEIRCAYQNLAFDDDTIAYLNEIECYLTNGQFFGSEAFYKQTPRYVPDWKRGDLFSHILTYPAAENLGIMGWNILLYKVGEYIDEVESLHQLMYVSICPPDKIPSCENDIKNLVFLRMMQLGERSEYLAQITIKSKKGEKSYGLTKIGCYPDIPNLCNYLEENPSTAMPLWGSAGRCNPWPGFEDQICRLYKKFGLQ